MFHNLPTVPVASLIILIGCGSEPSKPVESLSGTHDASAFVLRSLKGTRDGERLEVHALYGDGSQSLIRAPSLQRDTTRKTIRDVDRRRR